jgi:hypothetical protein
MDPDRARALLAERRARRLRAELQVKAAQAASELRGIFYDKQQAFFRSQHRRKATTKTRRAGATTGGCSELLARALTLEGHRAEQGFRASIIYATRVEARTKAWKNDTKSGLVDVLSRFGTYIPGKSATVYELGGQRVTVRESELALDFENGSRIDIFGCDSEDDLGRLRGNAKHVFWIDEAQDPRFSHLIFDLYKGTIVPAAADYRAETWLTGTPGKDLAGMFYEVTRDDEHRLTGWEVHALSVIDNPYFGSTPEERWKETALRALEENGWTEDEPDFQREWMGRWVKTDARFVYAANVVPIHELLYAPERLCPDGFPDVLAAMRDLPGYPERPYFLAMGNDLGTYAFALHAWSLHDPILYEVASYKRRDLDYDDMVACIIAVRDLLHVSILVADAGGGGKQAVMGWSKKIVERYGLPIIEATKTNKHTAQDVYNNDIRKRRMRYRGTPDKPSPLLQELLTHRWLPKRSSTGKLEEDPSTDNHCCDASLYAHRESYHHRFREQELQPQPNSAEWLQREERDLEEAATDPDDVWSGW